MSHKQSTLPVLGCLLLMLLTLTAPALSADDAAVAEHLNALQTMCTESADARADRQAKSSLYDRLGGYDKILQLTTGVVKRHEQNEEIKHTMKGVDPDLLAKHVADFVAAGTGGTAQYTGRSLPASHAHLELTDAHFLAAGGDIVATMKEMKYGQNEIDEFLCILVSLKDQVVFK